MYKKSNKEDKAKIPIFLKIKNFLKKLKLQFKQELKPLKN